MSKKSIKATKKTSKPTKKTLDEKTTALVLAEYLSLGEVATSEVDAVMNEARGLSYREIAIAFRMSEVLDVPSPFEVAPRYRDAFAIARAVFRMQDEARSQPEAA